MKAEVTYTYYSKQFDIVCEATGNDRKVVKPVQGDFIEDDIIPEPEYELKVIKNKEVVEVVTDLIMDELAGEFNKLKNKHILYEPIS